MRRRSKPGSAGSWIAGAPQDVCPIAAATVRVTCAAAVAVATSANEPDTGRVTAAVATRDAAVVVEPDPSCPAAVVPEAVVALEVVVFPPDEVDRVAAALSDAVVDVAL